MEEAQELNLRKACWSDCRFLFRLRNEDEVRKNSFQTSEIPYSSHENWFAQKLQDFNTVIYILERNGQAIGQVRADRQERTAEISYALCREARGRGLSRWMLSELENRLREDGFCNELYAEEIPLRKKYFDLWDIGKNRRSMDFLTQNRYLCTVY